MKHLHQNSEFRFNEVLFEHRNKQYGAYVLRNESDRMLTKALFVGVSLLAAVSITPLIINAFKADAIVENTDGNNPRIIKAVETPEKDPPKATVKPVQPVSPPNTRQYDSSVPTPTQDANEPIKEPIPDDAVAGLTNNLKGEPVVNTYIPPTSTIGTGPVISTLPPTISKPVDDKNKIVDINDLGKSADFVGGIDSFRNKVTNGFDGSGMESDEVMKTTVTFIVEIDGTISGIKANGSDADFNNEAIRTIKAISNKGKWIPGKNKQGESVRSYFRFPISMKFDN